MFTRLMGLARNREGNGMDVNVRVAGEAGQGVQTTGLLLDGAFARMGLHVFSTQSYMSRIRGGLNSFDIRVADEEMFSGREKADILVALTDEALRELGAGVTSNGVTLFNGTESPDAVAIEFGKIAREISGKPIMANTVAAGAVFAVLGYDVEALCGYLADEFKGKPAETIEGNVACARRGWQLAAKAPSLDAPHGAGAEPRICDGSAAVGLAAATAGVKLVCSYPMTPSTGVFTFLAGVADEYGIVVEQAEDEIAAINMVCGAAYAGAPAMTTTSGGGFALMAEGLSLAGMMELPAFIVLSQRPGPATGLPTRTGQEDLKFAVYASHGEFARAVYAPGSARQAHVVTRVALQTAHKYQTPAILLIDQFLADQRKNAPQFDMELRPIDRHVLLNPAPDYVRYAPGPGGVSPRALPGGDVFVICDSDEHTEDGHLTEDLSARVRMQDKRLKKAEGMRDDVLPPERYGPPDADWLLVSWGSTYGPCREAVDILNASGHSAALLSFAQVWPLNGAMIRQAIGRTGAGRPTRIICVENNATGQFASLLREQDAAPECETMLKYNGMPFTGQEIAGRALA